MTAYEVTQDLLDATTAANPAAAAQPRKRSGLVRFRAAITGGVAAGALLLATPVAAAAAVPAGPAHGVVAAGAESTLPSSITLTPGAPAPSSSSPSLVGSCRLGGPSEQHQRVPTGQPHSVHSMRNVLIGVGGLVTVLGLLFLLQGTGLVHGSPMTNNHFWIYAGAVIAIVGAVLLTTGLRRPARR